MWTFEFGILHREEKRLLLCGLSSLVFFIMRKRGCSCVDFRAWYSLTCGKEVAPVWTFEFVDHREEMRLLLCGLSSLVIICVDFLA